TARGCPGWGRRPRGRSQPVGRRGKCPHRGAATALPAPMEAGATAAPTMSMPRAPGEPPACAPGSRPATVSVPPPVPVPAPVAPPSDWGVGTPAPGPKPFGGDMPQSDKPVPPAPLPVPAKRPAAASQRTTGVGPTTPDQLAAPGWRKAKAGLFWVLFALLLL